MNSARPVATGRQATGARSPKLITHLVVLVCIWLGPHASGSEEPTVESELSSATSGDPVTMLSEGEFAIRSHSTRHLWSNRARWGKAVATACRSSDPEVASRARWVRGRWRRGILPGLPDDLVATLSVSTPGEAIELLLQAGRFDAAVVAVEEAAATLEEPIILQRAAVLMDTQFPLYVRLADQSGQEASFRRFLDVACSTKELAACRVQWMHVLGLPVDDENRLPACAQSWSDSKRDETLCLIHLLEGDVKRAETIAARRAASTPPGQRSLLRVVRMLTGQWEAVAQEAARAAEQATRRGARTDRPADDSQADNAEPAAEASTQTSVGPNQWRLFAIRHWNDTLLAATRCGRDDLRDQAVAALSLPTASPVDPTPDDGSADPGSSDAMGETTPEATKKIASELRWRGLMVHGYVDAALPIARDTDPREYSSLLAALSRFDAAFDALERPSSQLDVKLEHWIDTAIESQQQLNGMLRRDTRLASEMNDLLVLMRLLLRVGREEEAFRIVRRMSDDQVLAGVARARDHVLHRLIGTTRADWAFDLAMLPDETEEPRGLTLRVLTPGLVVQDERLLPAISAALALDHPDWSPRKRFRQACRIASSDLPAEPATTQLLVSLARRLADGTLQQSLQPGDVRTRARREILSMPSTASWVALFESHGRADLAVPLLADSAAVGDPESIQKLAKLQRRSTTFSGRTPTRVIPASVSDSWVDEVWTSLIDDPSRHDMMVGIESLIDHWQSARSRGDGSTAERLMRQIRQMACTPSTDVRQQIAARLAEAGEVALAEDLFKTLLLTTGMNSDETMAFIDIARAHYRFATEHLSPPEPDAVEMIHQGLSPATRTTTSPSTSRTKKSGTPHQQPAEPLRRLGKRRQALDWFDLSFAGTLELSAYRESTYVSLPLYIVHERLEIAAETLLYCSPSQSPELVRQIGHDLLLATNFDSVDITVAERTLPRLRQRGLADLADKTFDQIFAAGIRHTKEFPRDSMTANNVAWSAAMNGRHLPEALRLARRAVSIEPDSAIYRDTLAELLAMTGHPEQAAQIERACVLDDPGQWHLHQQIRRFDAMSAESSSDPDTIPQ